MQRLRILGDRFVRDGQPLTLWGFNYWHSASPGSDPVGGDWSVLCDYHAPTVEREVAAMAALGANTLRVWFAYAPAHWTTAHTLSATARRNLDHFLDCCARHGLYVIFTVGGGGSLWGAQRGLGSRLQEAPGLLYADPAVEDLFAADVLELIAAAGLGERPNMLAIDLANEPIFGIFNVPRDGIDATWNVTGTFNGSLRHPAMASAWRAWAREQLGLADAAVPEDSDFLRPGPRQELAAGYQAFVHACFNRHTRRLAQAIRERWPDLLVTMGFGCGGTGADFAGGAPHEAAQILMLTQNVREMQEGLDFVCVHFYDGTTPERLAFMRRFLGSEKPIVIEEFGYIPKQVDPATGRESAADEKEQTALWEIILAGVRQCNYAGALGCNYCDTGNSDPARNTWARMGVTTQAGQPKPAHEVFRRHAGDARPSADFHPEAMPYDPQAYRNSVQAIGEIFVKGYL